ncbi:MAG: radical SAM protein [Desulfonauticus sp.]|nr:radical SAM protein [Desulfonauticus sp.]
MDFPPRKTKVLFFGNKKLPPGEWGGRLPIALIFPEKKELAFSTLGWQAVLRELLLVGDFVVERFFGQGDQTSDLHSYDTNTHLSFFPVWTFSLNFELDTLNVLRYLNSCNLPLRAEQRKGFPLLIAGGPLVFLNPYPILPAFDLMFVGECEGEFVSLLQKLKNAYLNGASKQELIEFAKKSDFILTLHKKARRYIYLKKDFYPAYSLFISSKTTFRDTFLLEINRGCLYGCRFCAAGYIYRPFREISLQTAQEIVSCVHPKKVGLVGTALTDWPYLHDFLAWLAERKIKFSLSSLRFDGLSEDLLIFLRKQGLRSLTIAVEGISQRIRQAINKRFCEKKFFSLVEKISVFQFNTLKLYFILGFPDEQESDFTELENFLKELVLVKNKARGKKKSGLNLVQISASFLVPKPWTPLQWMGMEELEILEQKRQRFKKLIKNMEGVRFSGENPILAIIQAIIARGDVRVFDFIQTALRENSWKKAYKQAKEHMKIYLQERKQTDIFPWDDLDIGLKKDFLWQEYLKFKQSQHSSICKKGCTSCNRCGLTAWLKTREKSLFTNLS